MDRKLGLIAFANDGGLGAQTRRLARMLKPERVMIIDSSGFSPNRVQHFDWYKDYPSFVTRGFPNNEQVKKFLEGLTHAFCAENPYNFGLYHFAKDYGVKVYCQVNYEFCENLAQPWLPTPTKFLMPSYWKLKEMERTFGADSVVYLPPPVPQEEFEEVREHNLKKTGGRKFLHIIGTAVDHDRNGTVDLLKAVQKTKGDFELVIRSQHPIPMDLFLDDPRVKYDIGNLEKNWQLYWGFDALLLPRRWGGLCLPMNEALACGIPVLMTNITPNKEILPKKWLSPVTEEEKFMTRAPIDTYSVKPLSYAKLIDKFVSMSDKSLKKEKIKAVQIYTENYSEKALLPKYLELFDDRQA